MAELSPLTPEERRLRRLLRLLAALFGLAVLGYLLPTLAGPWTGLFIQLPFVTNSVVKIGGFALLAFFASGDVRRHRLLILLLLLGHVLSVLAIAAVLLWGDTTRPAGIRGVLVGALLLDAALFALVAWAFRAAERARYALRYLSPLQFRSLAALAEVVITGDGTAAPLLDAETVARNVDRYLDRFEGRMKFTTRLALTGLELYPLLSFRPPLSYLDPASRLDFVKRRFYRTVLARLVPEGWRQLVRGLIGMGKQLCYLGYYNDPRTFESVGYVPFSKRPHPPIQTPRKPLHVLSAANVGAATLSADVVIVGSGAAASVLAQGLVAKGRDVLLVERGRHVDPSQLSEDEAEMLGRLFADGALQLTRAFDFQVLQGSCVGGTTVVNNAVCFDLPPDVLARWNSPELGAGLDPSSLEASFQAVRALLRVQKQTSNLNPGATLFEEGVRKLRFDRPPHRFDRVDANIESCLGCGYCNIGCAYGRKLSMLDTVLPDAQEAGRRSGRPDGLRILAGCEVEQLSGAGRTVTKAVGRFGDGRRLDITGKVFIVAAGAVSSPLLLLRSGLGGKQVGRNASFNMGSPLAAVFDRKLDAYAGLQISHYLEPSPGRGYVLETWFNPPVAQALSMPGWFEDHFRNMRRYDRMAATGVLVGTEPNAVVRIGGLTGREIEYEPSRGDLEKLLDGLELAARIYLAAGATCVMPSTWRYLEIAREEELPRLREAVGDATDITVGTGHPQGGNAVSRDPALGVVDPEFRVFGWENLHVCDASVFPTSIGVNPQLTVMALAHYATSFIR